MEYKRSDLEAVRRAIASGLLEVRYGDKTVRYPSMSDLVKAEQHIIRNLNAQQGKRSTRIYRVRNKGKGV